MTGLEAVLELGAKIIDLRIHVAAMTSQLDFYKDREGRPIAWRSEVDRIESQSLAQIRAWQIQRLDDELRAASPEEWPRILRMFAVEPIG